MALVFDFDGVIGDTQPCWDAAYRNVLVGAGRAPEEAEAEELAGASVSQAARILEVDEDRLRSSLREAFLDFEATPMPGAAGLVSRVARLMPVGLATNGPEELVREALAALNLLGHFDVVVSGEGVGSLKPAPDVYAVACEQLEVDPSDAIAIEDSALGVTAAAAAGLFVVQVGPGPATPEADLHFRDLTHPGISRWLQLPSPPYETERAHTRIALHRACARILRDDRVRGASSSSVRELTSALRSTFSEWAAKADEAGHLSDDGAA